MILTLDTTFFMLHYFSRDREVLDKTKRTLHLCRRLGNRGILPTIVLCEFYAITHKSAGKIVAEKHFNEMVNSGLRIVELSVEVSRMTGMLRRKYEERIPWGDCIIAASAIKSKADYIITEDPHFKLIKEIKSRRLEELKQL